MYEWQTSNWQNLVSANENKRLAHGLLFHGPAGIGKNEFATEFAHWLICEQPDSEKSCGHCKACHLIQAESHPDLLHLNPEEEGKSIKIDQVRGLINKTALTRYGSGYRVILISPADALNANASNSLLKTLEEPSENTILILVSDKPSKIMATIRSRTQMIRFALPTTEQSLQWLEKQNVEKPSLLLKLCSGSPLSARAMDDTHSLQIREKLFNNWQDLALGKADALDSASLWIKEGFKVIGNMPLNWVSSWIMDMIRNYHNGHIKNMANEDYAQALQKLAGQVDLKSVYGLLDRLNDMVRLTNTQANQQTLIEGLLIHWAGLKRI